MSESLHDRPEIEAMQEAITQATEIVAGPGADPLEVFPDPAQKDRRADIIWPLGATLTSEQETAFREVAAILGPGREQDVSASEQGLHDGYTAIIEGGQGHKMLAEMAVVLDDAAARPDIITLSAAKYRTLKDPERNLTARVLDLEPEAVGDTEYEVGLQILEQVPGLQLSQAYRDRQEKLMYGHGTQYVGRIGLEGAHVFAVGVNKAPHPDHPNDPSKYKPSLDNLKKMLTAIPNAKHIGMHSIYTRNVGFVTSATYEPSNVVTAIKAEELDPTAVVRVVSYGIDTLARVRNEEPKQPSLDQLATELFKAEKRLRSL